MKKSITTGTAREGQGGTEIRSARKNTPALWLALLLVLMLFGMACGRMSKPQGFAEPQLDGDTLYVTLDPGKIASVNASDFSVNWEFPEGKRFACGGAEESDHDLRAIYGAPLIDGDAVYFGAYDGNVYAVNAEDGSCKWQSHKATDTAAQCQDREPDGPIIGGMALVEGILYVGSDDGQLYGIDADSGAVHSCVDLGGAIWTTPLVNDEKLYVTTMEGAVWSARTTRVGDLEPTQIFKTDAALLTDPVLAGDKLLVGGMGQKLYAIDPENGEKAWEFGGGNWFWGRPVADGDIVYATNLDGKLYAINLADGEAAWADNAFKADEPIRAGALISDGVVVVADRAGNIYSLNAETGKVEKESLSVIEKRVLANPVELDGAVLVVTQDGDLYRVEPSGDEPPKRVTVVEP